MSGYSGSSAPGNTSSGDGQTTVVGLNNRLSGKDEEVLCGVMCPCSRIGVATRPMRNGARIMRQKCVEQRLNAMNESSIAQFGAPTEYRPEVAYDMSPKPPAPPVPIMSEEDSLAPHNSMVRWIIDNWPGGMKGYRAGKDAGLEQIRRPDVVIVQDPTQPPVQSNIKTVVEMKFEDEYRDRQRDAYVRIAGGDKKVVTLRPADCGCRNEDPDEKAAQSTQTQSDTEKIFGLGSGGANQALPPQPSNGPAAFPGYVIP